MFADFTNFQSYFYCFISIPYNFIFISTLLLGCPITILLVVDGYIWRYAKRVNATIFFRGIRSWEKDGKDEQSLQILNTWGPLVLGPLYYPIPTIYLEGHPKYNHVSSTLIRNICKIKDGGGNKDIAALTELVPSEIATRVAQLYCAKQQ